MSALDTTTPTTQLPAGTWQIDPLHSTIGFKVRHFGVSWFRGAFREVQGSLTTGANGLEAVDGEVVIKSVDVDNEQLHAHLLSPDFFDADNHPSARFVSTSVEVRDDALVVNGELTLRGVTQPLTLEATVEGVGDDAYGNTRVGLEATGAISRQAYGIKFDAVMPNGVAAVVGDEVRIVLSVEAFKASK